MKAFLYIKAPQPVDLDTRGTADGVHKNVLDVWLPTRGVKGALCVCLDCGLTWDEGAAPPAYPQACVP